MFGGLVPGDTSISPVLRVDLTTGAAHEVARLAVAAHDAAATTLNGAIYLFGGSGEAGTLVQRFDPASRRVSTIGHLPRPLSDLSAVTIGDTMYVLGGYDGEHARPEVMATTDGASFKTVATLPHGLRYAAVTHLGTTVIVAGGQTDTSAATRDVFSVDTSNGAVRVLSTLPVPIAHAALIARGNSAFIVGGRYGSGQPTDRVWGVRISDGTLFSVAPLSMPLADTTLLITSAGDAILAGGATGRSTSGGETRKELFFRAA
jgi:N-acetylneuraminic acid mutarotase